MVAFWRRICSFLTGNWRWRSKKNKKSPLHFQLTADGRGLQQVRHRISSRGKTQSVSEFGVSMDGQTDGQRTYYRIFPSGRLGSRTFLIWLPFFDVFLSFIEKTRSFPSNQVSQGMKFMYVCSKEGGMNTVDTKIKYFSLLKRRNGILKLWNNWTRKCSVIWYFARDLWIPPHLSVWHQCISWKLWNW